MFPPYAATVEWYVEWLKNRINGSSTGSIAVANKKCCVGGKDYSRTWLLTGKGEKLMLSMALEGGSGRLKNIDSFEEIRLSNHGNWRKNHLGAIEAVYRKAPFYDFIIDELQEVYNNYELETLASFNGAIHDCVVKSLTGGIYSDALNNLGEKNVVIIERGAEIAGHTDPTVSIIDPLMRFGPETLLMLINKLSE